MKKEFWLERWERSEIGFHQNDINPYLHQYWHELHAEKGSEIFVPLCGKSRDMLWLREQGYEVLGVELSPIAVQAFFEENNLSSRRSTDGKFARCETEGIRILCGDFFDLTREDVSKVSAVYDRASLIALPPDMRKRYASHLAKILPQGTQILLITIDYPQQEMQGPPFAVSRNDVESLYREYADMRLLAQVDVLEQNLRFRERGVSRMQENIFLLTLR